MKQKLLRSYITAIAVLFGLTFSASAQNFESDGSNASYNASCRGVIKIKAAIGTFVNTNGADEGTSTNPIDGTVEFAKSTAGAQTVPGFYYTSLVLSGTAKTVQTGVYITGGACAIPLITGYENLATYPFYETTGTNVITYNGVFNYASDLPQTIYPQYATTAGTDMYNTLNLEGTGIKTVGAGDQVGTGTLTTNAATPLEIDGIMQVGAGPSTLNGTLTLDNVNAEFNLTNGPVAFENTVTLTNGTLELTSSGNATFNDAVTTTNGSIVLSNTGNAEFNDVVTLDGGDITLTNAGNATFGANVTNNAGLLSASGTGDIIIETGATLALTATAASVELLNNADLVITGSFTNAGDGTNLDFSCTSTVTYNGNAAPQLIVPTIGSNPYGNLLMAEGNKRANTSTYGSDIYLCTNFSLSDGNLDMYTNSGTLHMTSLTKNPYYGLALDGTTVTGNGLEEVYGKFQRVTNNTDFTYVFNNKVTYMNLDADNDNPESVTFDIRTDAGVEPNNYDATRDLYRKVNIAYTQGTNNGDFAHELRVGYSFDDRPNWTSPNGQETLRMYEADDAGGVDDVEKIGTGNPRVNVSAVDNSSLGYVQLAGILKGTGAVSNGIDKFTSGHDVLLRTGPTTFYSIRDGRWSNPDTWDEGITPTSIDNAELRHIVYVGIDAPFVGTTDGTGTDDVAKNNTKDEYELYSNNEAINKVTIADYTNAALLIGNEDNPQGWVFKTKLTTDYSLINNNTTVSTAAFPLATPYTTSKGTLSASTINGVWLLPLVGARDENDYYPILSTQKIQNKGTVNNEGMIELGE